jgi:hypothetical protein
MADNNGPLKFRFSPVFEPLLAPARYKGAWGGRVAASRTFSLAWPSRWRRRNPVH